MRQIRIQIALFMIIPALFGFSAVDAAESSEQLSQEVAEILADVGMTADQFLLQAAEVAAVQPSDLRYLLTDANALLSFPLVAVPESNVLDFPATINEGNSVEGDIFAKKCKSPVPSGSISYKNAYGMTIARFTMYKSFCYDGRVVSDVLSWTDAWIAAWAVNWTYDGVVSKADRCTDSVCAIHYSMRQGKFTASYGKWSITRLPRVEIVAYSSGLWEARGRG